MPVCVTDYNTLLPLPVMNVISYCNSVAFQQSKLSMLMVS
jgi:hypothetical protein